MILLMNLANKTFEFNINARIIPKINCNITTKSTKLKVAIIAPISF